MLDKFIIHLKNIIFFKSIIYIICIVLLAVLVTNIQKQLIEISEKKEKAQKFLNQTTIQFNSIAKFEEKISETNLKYKNLILNSGKKGCEDRAELLKNLDFIAQKYDLYEPIKLEMSSLSDPSYIKNKNTEITLRNHEALVSFTVNSYEKALNVSDDIYTILPKGSLVISASLKKMEALTPEIIAKLSTKGFPGLINVSIKVHLREIIYEG